MSINSPLPLDKFPRNRNKKQNISANTASQISQESLLNKLASQTNQNGRRSSSINQNMSISSSAKFNSISSNNSMNQEIGQTFEIISDYVGEVESIQDSKDE